MDAAPEALPELTEDAGPPSSTSPERVAARRAARHASSALAATATTGILSVFALLAHHRHLVPPEYPRFPLVALALAAMIGGGTMLLLGAHDCSWAARVDRPGATAAGLRVGLAGLILAGLPILAASALLIVRTATGARVRAPLAALAFPALFVASAAAFGLLWIGAHRTVTACLRDPAAHPEPALWKARADGTRACLIGIVVLLVVVPALCAGASLLGLRITE